MTPLIIAILVIAAFFLGLILGIKLYRKAELSLKDATEGMIIDIPEPKLKTKIKNPKPVQV
jgi:hypothetical protein